VLTFIRSFWIAIIITFLFLSGCSTSDDDTGTQIVIDQSPEPDPDPDPDPDLTPAPSPDEFDFGAVYSHHLYVSPTGSDTAGDGSADMPFQTVAYAASNATPGTRINLQAGTYPADGTITNLHGTANEPIAIVANGNVVFDAAGATQVVLHFRDPRYVVLQGFTVQNTSLHGVNIDDGGSYDTPAEFVILRNIIFRNIGSGGNNDCLKMSGVDNFIITGSEFDDCANGEAIDMVGCHNGIVKENYFHNIPRNAVGTKGGSADILIERNRFSDVASRAINAGGATGLPYFRPIDAPYEAARIRMHSNIFERVGAFGGASVAFTGCDACVFANNTIIEPQSNIARILQESQDARFIPSRNGYFINNLIVFNQADIGNYVGEGSFTAPETFTFGNNLWYALDNPGFSGPTYSTVPPETNSIIQQDPQINLAGEDYHISLASPAAGQGRSVPGTIDADYDGIAFDIPIDIGAYKATP
jgi:hypothetical protein